MGESKGGMSRFLITGGTGTFGRAFIARILDRPDTERLVCFSRDEVKQGELASRYGGFNHPRLRLFLGDIRDTSRLTQAMHGIDVVIHAAALKRVEQGAYSPFEMVQTNILGTRNVIEAAATAGVSNVMVLSSDKAVAPWTLYGGTKFCAEQLAVYANSYTYPRGTRIAAVRYGNVFGSRGSVIDVWRQYAQRGDMLPITSPHMTRFWITLDEAIDLVVRALPCVQGGEIFVPVLPSVHMVDVAQAVAAEAGAQLPYPLQLIGLRPGGEKLHEELLTIEEVPRTYGDVDRVFYAVTPSHRLWSGEPWVGFKVDPDLLYRSDVNPWVLSVPDIQLRLRAIPKSGG